MLREQMITEMLCNNVRSRTAAELEAMDGDELDQEYNDWAYECRRAVEFEVARQQGKLAKVYDLGDRRTKHLFECGKLESAYEVAKAKRLERGRFKTDKERVAAKQKFRPFNW